jgi:hypothetical protein
MRLAGVICSTQLSLDRAIRVACATRCRVLTRKLGLPRNESNLSPGAQ